MLGDEIGISNETTAKIETVVKKMVLLNEIDTKIGPGRGEK